MATEPAAIPEVDLSLPDADAAEQLRWACESVGFFYLVRHGVSASLQAQVYAEMAAFFRRPLADKLRVRAGADMRGYTPMASETLDPSTAAAGDSKEGFYLGRHSSACLPLHGPNRYPDGQPCFRPVMDEYHGVMSALGLRVARLFAAAAGSPGAFDAAGMFDEPIATLRLLHYAAHKSDAAAGRYAAGPHTDYGLLTLLSTDSEPGLEIWHRGVWMAIPPRPGAFVVNVGDMGERWTNGRFPSTRHRVLNVTGCERYSAPFFFEPNFTCRVQCLPSCVSPDRPARYAPTTSGEHLLGRYRATHADFTG